MIVRFILILNIHSFKLEYVQIGIQPKDCLFRPSRLFILQIK